MCFALLGVLPAPARLCLVILKNARRKWERKPSLCSVQSPRLAALLTTVICNDSAGLVRQGGSGPAAGRGEPGDPRQAFPTDIRGELGCGL